MAWRASAASRSKAKRWTWMRVSSSSEMSPFSARMRCSRSTSSSALRFSPVSASVASATSVSVNAFLTCATTCRRVSSSSAAVTRLAARALSSRRARLPPSSIGWPRLKVYCGSFRLPICSAREEAVGFGRRPAVISCACVARYSCCLARSVGFSRSASATASSSDRRVAGACASASAADTSTITTT